MNITLLFLLIIGSAALAVYVAISAHKHRTQKLIAIENQCDEIIALARSITAKTPKHLFYDDLFSLYSKRTSKTISVEYSPIPVKSAYLRVSLANDKVLSSTIECKKCYSEFSDYKTQKNDCNIETDYKGYVVAATV